MKWADPWINLWKLFTYAFIDECSSKCPCHNIRLGENDFIDLSIGNDFIHFATDECLYGEIELD